MTEKMNEKSLLIFISEIAENTTNDLLVTSLHESIIKYKKAQLKCSSEKELKDIFSELVLVSYVIMFRCIDKSKDVILKDIEDMLRVYELIKPKLS